MPDECKNMKEVPNWWKQQLEGKEAMKLKGASMDKFLPVRLQEAFDKVCASRMHGGMHNAQEVLSNKAIAKTMGKVITDFNSRTKKTNKTVAAHNQKVFDWLGKSENSKLI